VGYFKSLWIELDAWNAGATTKIRAVTPYRWTKNDDGTGRDASIGTKPSLLVDLQKAFASKPQWTTPKACGSTGTCVTDDDCAGKTICDLTTGKCAPTTACSPACPATMICRAAGGDCVPENRGESTITVLPSSRTAPVDVVLDAFDTRGLTNVEMDLESLYPTTKVVTTTWIGLKDPHYHWQWSAHATVEGTYRATFRADPGRHVYAIAYFDVAGPDVFPDAGVDAGGDVGVGHDASIADASDPGNDLTTSDDKGGCNCALVGGDDASGDRGITLFCSVLASLALARRRR
jgi:hypothetical protein